MLISFKKKIVLDYGLQTLVTFLKFKVFTFRPACTSLSNTNYIFYCSMPKILILKSFLCYVGKPAIRHNTRIIIKELLFVRQKFYKIARVLHNIKLIVLVITLFLTQIIFGTGATHFKNFRAWEGKECVRKNHTRRKFYHV